MSGLRWLLGNARGSKWGRLQHNLPALGMALVTAVFTERVQAVPQELRAGVEVGATTSSRTDVSPTLGVRGGYGLASNLELQVEASGVWLQRDPKPLLTQLVPALAYRFDVVRWVPFVRVGAGGLVDWQQPALIGLASGAVGLEYLWDRSLALSLTYQADVWVLRPEHAVPAVPLHRALLGVIWSSGW